MVRVTTRILRKQDDLPRYIVVGSDALEGRRTAFAADVWLNGAGPFRRNVRPWRKGADVFFVNLTAPQCVAAGVATGDSCEVTIAAVEA
jgi:hypothetical protein